MASRSYSSSLLSVLIILLALKYSSANCCEGIFLLCFSQEILEQRESGQGAVIQEKMLKMKQDTKFLWGRKMLQGLDEKPLYISGTCFGNIDQLILRNLSQNYKQKNNGEMFEQKGNHKSEGSRVPSGVDEHQRSQNSMPRDSADPQATTPTSSGNENVVAKDDHYITKKNDEAKAFLEAADEVANMMRKDYRGAPRRKPPINNHQPKD
ncbi:hypothetical protein Pfo_008834 [Paulownia fortunei]|nr:hypothetical protein Pfo_008834 [Paulownia fortunei]